MTQQTPALAQSGNNPVLNHEAFGKAASAAGVAGGTMTVLRTYAITVVLLILLVAGAAVGWSQVEVRDLGNSSVATMPAWVWLATLGVFVLAIITAVNPGAAPITAPTYALVEGAVLGVVSKFFDLDYEGIVLQAVGATVAVFAVMLLLYASRIVRATPRLVVGVIAAMGGLMLLYFVAWITWLFGVDVRFWDDPSPVGVALAVGVVVLGALTLPIHFDFIERASEARYPSSLAWYGAYGLMLSLIWIYLSILRVLAILRR